MRGIRSETTLSPGDRVERRAQGFTPQHHTFPVRDREKLRDDSDNTPTAAVQKLAWDARNGELSPAPTAVSGVLSGGGGDFSAPLPERSLPRTRISGTLGWDQTISPARRGILPVGGRAARAQGLMQGCVRPTVCRANGVRVEALMFDIMEAHPQRRTKQEEGIGLTCPAKRRRDVPQRERMHPIRLLLLFLSSSFLSCGTVLIARFGGTP